MGIKIFSGGSYSHVEKSLQAMLHGDIWAMLDQYGQMGVDRLAASTPKRTGLTASSWSYKVINDHDTKGVIWYNDNVNEGEEIAILIQYGHGTGTGGYVEGVDYVNPAMQPLFDELTDALMKEVMK